MSFQDRIDAGLERALPRAVGTGGTGEPDQPPRLDLHADSLIIFSDHHKGARNRADDFVQCEPAYLGALAHYFAHGFRLAILGDGEELWEERPRSVVEAYAKVFAAEARFHVAGRYQKFWGNHDEQWRSGRIVERWLCEPFGGRLPDIAESACYTLTDNGEVLGTLYLVHGHQGTHNNERWAVLARLTVRWLWRPIQQLTGYSSNTPASNRELRNRHNSAMYGWASRQEGLLLVTGHTHRPVFGSLSWLDHVEKVLQMEVGHAFADHPDPSLWAKLDRLARSSVWIGGAERVPSYFNAGCCCFPDGSITGLELSDGEIRLVRWDTLDGEPQRRLLATAPARELLARV
ncbi:MAG: hypothetical protein V3U67_10435 [Gemmatimonadota bacterium]